VANASKYAHLFWRYKYLTESNQQVIYQVTSEQPKSYEASLIELNRAATNFQLLPDTMKGFAELQRCFLKHITLHYQIQQHVY